MSDKEYQAQRIRRLKAAREKARDTKAWENLFGPGSSITITEKKS